MDSLFFDLAGFFCIVGAITLIGLFVWNIFWILEWAYQPSLTETGQILNKGFVPSYEEHVLVQNSSDSSLDTSVIYRFPDSWWVEVKIFSHKVRLGVNQQIFEALQIGDTVTVQYRAGRITGRPHIQTIVDV